MKTLEEKNIKLYQVSINGTVEKKKDKALRIHYIHNHIHQLVECYFKNTPKYKWGDMIKVNGNPTKCKCIFPKWKWKEEQIEYTAMEVINSRYLKGGK